MKFDELCEFVLQEADRDTLTGIEKPFMVTDEGLQKILTIGANDMADLVNKVAKSSKGVGVTPKMIEYIVKELKTNESLDLEETGMLKYATPTDIKELISDYIRDEYGIRYSETSDKATRAADKIFSWLKQNDYIKALSQEDLRKQRDEAEARRSKEEQETVDRLASDFETDVPDEDEEGGFAIDDVERLGGSVEKQYGHPEDESNWY